MKQIFLLFMLVVFAQWFAKILRRRAREQREQAVGARKRSRAEALPEPMVRCATCGVYVPKSEAITMAGRSFCRDGHARQYAERASDDAMSSGSVHKSDDD